MSFINGTAISEAGKMISAVLIEKIKDFAVNVLPDLWRVLVKWLLKTLEKKVKKGKIEGFKYFAKNAGKECLNILKEYYLKDDQWYKRETTQKVKPEEVPYEIRFKAAQRRGLETDCSNELENKLELCV